MYILNKVNDESVNKACDLVRMHFQDLEFIDILGLEKDYNHTNHTAYAVALAVRFDMDNITVYVRPYKTVNPFSRVIGYAEGNTIYVNTRKTLPVLDRAENIFHECMHLIGYSHKGNRVTKYNLETVPYKAARLFREYLESIYGK